LLSFNDFGSETELWPVTLRAASITYCSLIVAFSVVVSYFISSLLPNLFAESTNPFYYFI
jgi:hypothetical protein